MGVYGFLTLQWFLVSDFVDLKNHHRWATVPPSAAADETCLVALGKAIHLTWAVGIS